mmetsp:Transcript_13064/g.20526  ORF Transcript_13064/g.20526 Transcript_13064/m.20526 type:complete len:244 (+) Transcript_13064:2-733(+)
MHPQLRLLPSLLFYSGCVEEAPALASRVNKASRLSSLFPQGPEVPRVLCHIAGREIRDGQMDDMDGHFGEGSDKAQLDITNPSEADKVVEVIERIFHHCADPGEVMVVTPYETQRALIQQRLEASKVRHLVHTSALRVCGLQDALSQSADFVIISTVRSVVSSKAITQPSQRWVKDHLGILADHRLLSFFLTSAKHGLFIIGNMEVLGVDCLWRQVTQFFKDTACFTVAESWPTLESQRYATG